MRTIGLLGRAIAALWLGLWCLAASAAEPTTTVVARDGQSEIAMPADWLEWRTGLNDEAEIQIGSRLMNRYLIVVAESKRSAPGLERFAQVSLDALRAPLRNVVAGRPAKLEIGGLRALQSELKAGHGDHDIGYLHTSIEGQRGYYQVVAWCKTAEFEALKPLLVEITASFRERPDE